MSREVRLQQALAELGGAFVKLGQIISTRADLVGPEVAAALASLRADTEPDPPAVVRELIAAELGGPPETLFASFDDHAIASASIGQVHRAVLADGTRVVVKIQHAGIDAKIRADCDIFLGLAELAERGLVELRLYQPMDALHGLVSVIAPADTRLVGHDDQGQVQTPHPPQALDGPGQKHHAGRIGQIVPFLDDGAVAVQKHRRARGCGRCPIGICCHGDGLCFSIDHRVASFLLRRSGICCKDVEGTGMV